MTSLAIDIADQEAEELRSTAQRLGIPAEELVRALIADMLSTPSEDFSGTLEHVLSKNEELYRRLA